MLPLARPADLLIQLAQDGGTLEDPEVGLAVGRQVHG